MRRKDGQTFFFFFFAFLTPQLRKYHLRQFWLCTVILNLYPRGRQFKVQCAIETTLWVTPGTRRSLSGEDLKLTHMEIVSKVEAKGASEKRTTELKGKQKKLSQSSPIKLIDGFPGGLFPRCTLVCTYATEYAALRFDVFGSLSSTTILIEGWTGTIEHITYSWHSFTTQISLTGVLRHTKVSAGSITPCDIESKLEKVQTLK